MTLSPAVLPLYQNVGFIGVAVTRRFPPAGSSFQDVELSRLSHDHTVCEYHAFVRRAPHYE